MTVDSNIAVARGALERVCSGACLDEKEQYYTSTFIDHVNGAHLSGFEGITKSVARYKKVLEDSKITVQDQLADGNRVLCRFTVTGKVHGRAVSFDGMTLSRLDNGLIAEDWSVTDTLSLLRQIGLWRLLLIGLRSLKR